MNISENQSTCGHECTLAYDMQWKHAQDWTAHLRAFLSYQDIFQMTVGTRSSGAPGLECALDCLEK